MDHKTQIKVQVAVGHAINYAKKGVSAEVCLDWLKDKLDKRDLTDEERRNVLNLTRKKLLGE